MADDRLQILKMLEEGKITAEEASQLLEALKAAESVEDNSARAQVVNGTPGKARWMRIEVDERKKGNRVHIKLPLVVIKGAMSLDGKKRLLDAIAGGKGFVGIGNDNTPRDEHTRAAKEAFALAEKLMRSQKYDILVLDELNVAVTLGLIDIQQVIKMLDEKPPALHVIITGRNAGGELIEKADLVTEMKEIKHPFHKGIKAQKGIDY